MKRVCIDCGRLIGTGSRCLEHKRADQRRRNARRDPLATATYRSTAYRAARAEILAGATHCAWCQRPVAVCGPLTAGHIRPIRADLDLAADPAGLAPSCRSCQEKEKHRRG